MEIIKTVKITNRDGIKAVKNGLKANQNANIPNPVSYTHLEPTRQP